MPRFSPNARARIQERLLAAGERLFTLRGIRKVTVDELAAEALIAKATFYTFYENKESLYLAVAQRLRRQVF